MTSGAASTRPPARPAAGPSVVSRPALLASRRARCRCGTRSRRRCSSSARVSIRSSTSFLPRNVAELAIVAVHDSYTDATMTSPAKARAERQLDELLDSLLARGQALAHLLL